MGEEKVKAGGSILYFLAHGRPVGVIFPLSRADRDHSAHSTYWPLLTVVTASHSTSCTTVVALPQGKAQRATRNLS